MIKFTSAMLGVLMLCTHGLSTSAHAATTSSVAKKPRVYKTLKVSAKSSNKLPSAARYYRTQSSPSEKSVSIPPIYSVINLNSGQYLETWNTQSSHSIASLTKLMTAHVLLKHNKQRLDNCYTAIDERDRDLLKNTHTRLELNHSMSCTKLLEAMLIASDNWAASALSRGIAGLGSEEFIKLMNKEAKNLNMNFTHFQDSSGLSPSNTSTAHDLNILLSAVVQNPVISRITSSPEMVSLSASGKISYMHNTNVLVREMRYPALLSKTGYIKESQYNLIFVPSLLCGAKNIAIVIMGASSSAARSGFAQHLLKKYQCQA